MHELLAKFNLKFEDLTPDEVATLDKWAQALNSQEYTSRDILGYIESMIFSVEEEITSNNSPKHFTELIFRKHRKRHLEARLQNYIHLRNFLTAPEKAKAYVEAQLKNLSKQR